MNTKQLRGGVFCEASGKLTFRSYRLAERHLRRPRFGKRAAVCDAHLRIVPYRCPYCREWHVGHNRRDRD